MATCQQRDLQSKSDKQSGEQEIKSDGPDNVSDYDKKDEYTGRGCGDGSDMKEADTYDVGDRDDEVGEVKHDLKESKLVLLHL